VGRASLACVLAAVSVLAGCGSSSHRGAVVTVTVPAYGEHPQTTVTAVAAAPGSRVCAADARTFTRDTLMFLAHSGPEAAYPADLYYVIVRQDLADFEARSCDRKTLGDELRRRLTPAEQRAFVAALPKGMAATVADALRRADS
jgi:hypothetical protein